MGMSSVRSIAFVSLLAAIVACGTGAASTGTDAVGVTHEDRPVPATSSAVRVARSAKVGADTARDACRVTAQACLDRAVAGDAEGAVDCIPDEVVAIEGRQNLVAFMRQTLDEGKRQGVTIERLVVEAPSQMAMAEEAGPRGERRTFAILPKTLVLRVPGGTKEHKSFVIGVSEDDGRTWKFVEGAGLDASDVYEFFPNFPSSLELPGVER